MVHCTAQCSPVHYPCGWPRSVLLLQVSAAEERHRSLKEALEVDIAAIGGQADKIKVGYAVDTTGYLPGSYLPAAD